MAEFPIIPIDIPKLLSDTTDMNAAEFGAYHYILYGLWLNGGRLPLKNVRAWSRLNARQWKLYKDRLLRTLTIVDGVVSQKRLEDIRMKVREKRRKTQEAAEARWNKKPHASAYANGCADAMPRRYEMPSIKISKDKTSSTVSSECSAPQQGATEEASKPPPKSVAASHGLRVSPELQALMERKIRERT